MILPGLRRSRAKPSQAAGRFALALLGLLGALAPLPAQAAAQISLRARLEPERIGLGETATLSFEARTGLTPIDLAPRFTLDNLEIVSSPSQATEITIANGRLTRVIRLSWQVRPKTIGPASAHSLQIDLRGSLIDLPTQTIQVQQDPTGQAQGDPLFGEDDPFERLFGPPPWMRRRSPRVADPNEPPAAFVRAEVSSEQPFVNQQLLYTIYLYSRLDVASVNPLSSPAFRGFWTRDVPLPERLPTEIVTLGDQRYGRVPLLRRILFPLRAGEHILEPVQFQIAIQSEQSFFSPPMGRPTPQELSTPPLRIDVRPLPAGPPDFQGAVGPLALSASIEPADLRAGEAATLQIRMTGSGNLQGLPAPKLALPAGLRVFPPHESGADRLVGTNLRSERKWSYVVVPDQPGSYHLELPTIPYFDPANAEFAQAKTSPLALAARLPLPSLPATLGRSADLSGPGDTAGPNRRTPLIAAMASVGRSIATPPGMIALSGLLALAGFFWVRRSPRLEDEAARRFETELAEAAREVRPRPATALLDSAWGHLLADRWSLATPPPSAIWQRIALERWVAPPLAAELGRIAEDLHFLRTAPQLSNAEALRDEIIDRSRHLASKLGSRPPKA